MTDQSSRATVAETGYTSPAPSPHHPVSPVAPPGFGWYPRHKRKLNGTSKACCCFVLFCRQMLKGDLSYRCCFYFSPFSLFITPRHCKSPPALQLVIKLPLVPVLWSKSQSGVQPCSQRLLWLNLTVSYSWRAELIINLSNMQRFRPTCKHVWKVNPTLETTC